MKKHLSNKKLMVINQYNSYVKAIDFNQDIKVVFTSSNNGTIQVYVNEIADPSMVLYLDEVFSEENLRKYQKESSITEFRRVFLNSWKEKYIEFFSNKEEILVINDFIKEIENKLVESLKGKESIINCNCGDC